MRILKKKHTHFLACRTRYAKGLSHVYILITWMPEIISFIRRTLSSVLGAIFNRNSEVFFPNQTKITDDFVSFTLV